MSAAIESNPHFKFSERTAYEFGSLLRKIPANFDSAFEPSEDEVQIVDAAIQHANNGSKVLLSGLEAIGNVIAGTAKSDEYVIASANLADLGSLIQHLAVEAQFLQGTQEYLEWARERQVQRLAASKSPGGKHA